MMRFRYSLEFIVVVVSYFMNCFLNLYLSLAAFPSSPLAMILLGYEPMIWSYDSFLGSMRSLIFFIFWIATVESLSHIMKISRYRCPF